MTAATTPPFPPRPPPLPHLLFPFSRQPTARPTKAVKLKSLRTASSANEAEPKSLSLSLSLSLTHTSCTPHSRPGRGYRVLPGFTFFFYNAPCPTWCAKDEQQEVSVGCHRVYLVLLGYSSQKEREREREMGNGQGRRRGAGNERISRASNRPGRRQSESLYAVDDAHAPWRRRGEGSVASLIEAASGGGRPPMGGRA